MKNDNISNIEDKIARYFDNSMKESERTKFMSLIKENEDYRKLFLQYEKIWSRAENTEAFLSIDTKDDWTRVLSRIEASDTLHPTNRLSPRYIVLFKRVAAILLILITTAFILSRFVFVKPEMIYISCLDEKRSIILPDGSNVLLNSFSSLEYPDKFSGDIRLVKLEGEAFFDVAKDPENLFRVNAGEANIDVLGTKFNINVDRDLYSVNLGVVSGRVAFYTIDQDDNKLILQKDEQALLSEGIIRNIEVNDNNYLSWMTGILVFNNDSAEKVIDDLARHYKKIIKLDNKSDKNLTLTSKFENQDMDSILEELKLVLGINYTVYGDTISICINK